MVTLTAKYVVTLVTMTVLVVITGKYKIASITVTMMVTLTSESIPTNITSGWTLVIALGWPLSANITTWLTCIVDAIAVTVIIVCTTAIRAGIGYWVGCIWITGWWASSLTALGIILSQGKRHYYHSC